MGKKRIASSFNEQMRRIYQQYVSDGGTLPVKTDELYAFATRKNLWQPQPADVRKQFAKQMSQALRDGHFVDEKGRTVRRYHAVLTPGHDVDGNKIQQALWDDIDTAPRKHMEGAFQLRRGQIVGDCKQLKNDVDHFNDEHVTSKPIQLLLDFTDDVAEAETPGEYVAAVIE